MSNDLVNKADPTAMGRRTFNKLTLASAVAGIMFGTSSAQASPIRGGRLRAAVPSGSAGDTLDPHKSQGDSDIFRVCTLYSRLVDFKPGAGAVPALATEWEALEGGKKWVFKLRSGVEFHNGNPWKLQT